MKMYHTGFHAFSQVKKCYNVLLIMIVLNQRPHTGILKKEEKGGKSSKKEELFNLVITFTLLHSFHMCKCNINIKKDNK